MPVTQTAAEILAPLRPLLDAPLPVCPAASVGRGIAEALPEGAEVTLVELPRASTHVRREYLVVHLPDGRAWTIREHALAGVLNARATREITPEGLVEAVWDAFVCATQILDRAFALVDPAACARRLATRDPRAAAALEACPAERRPSWRDPITALVPVDALVDQGVTLENVTRAIAYFTGTTARTETYRDQEGRPVYLVTALGYRAGPAGP